MAPLPTAQGHVQAQAGYWLCFPDNRAELDPLLLLRRWLQQQVLLPASD